ncbi:MAG: GAF domain-containing protein [Planctomycetota bacterium]|nr:GAF domain-containing protein [Planctomycetota bacterium]
MDGDFGILYLAEDERDDSVLRGRAATGLTDSEVVQTEFVPPNTLVDKVLRSRELDEKYFSKPVENEPAAIRPKHRCIAFPLEVRERRVGVLLLAKNSRNRFDPENVRPHQPRSASGLSSPFRTCCSSKK